MPSSRLFGVLPPKLLLVCALGVGLPACAQQLDEEQPAQDAVELGETSASLQVGFARWVSVVQGTLGQSPPALSTGALRLANPRPGMNHGTCGVTFVSKRHAVTAAHCVADYSLTRTFNVEEIEISSFDSAQLAGYLTVSGSWNNGGWDNRADLNSQGGYTVVTHTGCRTTRRCDPSYFAREFCPIPENVDIAMIRCLGRTFTHYAQTSSVLSPIGLPRDFDDTAEPTITVWWFHELYGLPVTDDGTERWTHYGQLTQGEWNNNWHHQRYHQLLPLRSYRHASGGPLYRVVKPGAQENEPSTMNAIDAPGCHGTSGSGVFLGTSNILLGPVLAHGPAASASGKLCDDFNVAQPGTRRLYYVRAALTDSFVNGSPEVLVDR